MSKLILLQQAVEMTTLYRKEKENILDPAYRNKNILANCETFDRADIDSILAATDCVSIRVYYGMDDAFNLHAIIVGVNSKGEDIISEDQNLAVKTTTTTTTGGGISEDSVRCPPNCPPPSHLNGG